MSRIGAENPLLRIQFSSAPILGKRAVECEIEWFHKIPERFVIGRQSSKIAVHGSTSAKSRPGVTSVSDQHIQLGLTDFDDFRAVVFNEQRIHVARRVLKWALFPQAPMEAQGCAGRPTVARIT